MTLVLIGAVLALAALGGIAYVLWAEEDPRDGADVDPFSEAVAASMRIGAAGWEAAQAIHFSEQYEGRNR